MPEASAQKKDVIYYSFSADINPTTSESLLGACTKSVNEGYKTIYLLISSPGGSLAGGINLHNVLKGLPVKLITHNVGAINSASNVVFLAGQERYSCRNATFMFHGVGFDITTNTRFEVKNLREKLDSLLAEQKKLGAIITECTSIPAKEVEDLFLMSVTKDPAWAKEKGIIQDIREVQIPPGASIQQFVFKR